jgi:hypothetical protein
MIPRSNKKETELTMKEISLARGGGSWNTAWIPQLKELMIQNSNQSDDRPVQNKHRAIFH